MYTKLTEIDEILKKHDDYRSRCLNLIASENYSSDVVRSYLTSDLNNRYGCYTTMNMDDREYPGNKYINEFEKEVHKLVTSVFGGKYVDLRPIGGHMAGMAVVLGLLDPGDLVIEVDLADWGHGLVGPMCQISQFAETINVEYMKFDGDGSVDTEALKEMAFSLNPKMIIFGGSGTLFPEPVRELRKIADEKDILIAYDASHVTGLIAGKTFPNPLEEGADIMFGSTHKSFPGPQGGFIVSDSKELMEKVGNALAPSLVTSHHINRLPAFAASLLEIKAYGEAYAQQVIKNSKALGKAMADLGFKVKGASKGYSHSHLILVDLGDYIAEAPGKYLELAGILCSDDFAGEAPEVRIGTPEVTRRGMKEEDMAEIAQLFKRALMDKENIETLNPDVEKLALCFTDYEYAFK
jgi:glycine hydroxymethyltransferase